MVSNEPTKPSATLWQRLTTPITSEKTDARLFIALAIFGIATGVGGAIYIVARCRSLRSLKYVPNAIQTLFLLRAAHMLWWGLLPASWLWLDYLDRKGPLSKEYPWRIFLRASNPFDRTWTSLVEPADVSVIRRRVRRQDAANIALLAALLVMFLGTRTALRELNAETQNQIAAQKAEISALLSRRKITHKR